MRKEKIPGKAAIAANQNIEERDYWLKKLAGQREKCHFPHDHIKNGTWNPEHFKFHFNGETSARLLELANNSDPRLHMILSAILLVELYRYTGKTDIIIGIPIYRQEVEADFTNTALALRITFNEKTTFKEFLLQVRQTLTEAVRHMDYPIEMLPEKLNLADPADDFPLFDTVILLENIHDKKYVLHLEPDMIFSFSRTGEAVEGEVAYNPLLYKKTTVERICSHFRRLAQSALPGIDTALPAVEMFSAREKNRLLHEFNDTRRDYPQGRTIHGQFEAQAEKTPGNIAVTGPDSAAPVTYGELNREALRAAAHLRKRGVRSESVVGIMMEPSTHMAAALLGILKAGAAYLPLAPSLSLHRIHYMMEDSGARHLVTRSGDCKDFSFTALQNFESDGDVPVTVTSPREPVGDFDKLPVPDRSLIDLRNYKDRIGMASVTRCISLQTTRGCPYECLFCHKVWSKTHVYRSARNIYDEIEYYYRRGVVNFSIIDDCFNLHRENSMPLFRLIVKNRLDIRLFFPNGLRGDLLTPDYIDLMAGAGTRGINLSLETASPRLQKLVKKNLDLDKFRNVMDYIAGRHPGIMLEIAAMHGFPTETEEEAMMTLDFIKQTRWLHFPYIHILKIYPNTEMEALALEHGISKEDILRSRHLAYHELPDTLPFPKSFTRKYQADFMNNYFLDRERLCQVLPVQMEILSEEALLQKYNTYLPAEISTVEDILRLAGSEGLRVPVKKEPAPGTAASLFDSPPPDRPVPANAGKILLLDLSRHFSDSGMLYDVSGQAQRRHGRTPPGQQLHLLDARTI